MSIAKPKQALYEQFATVAKALGNPLRLELIEHLGQGPRSVDALAVKLGLPIANVSQHLQAMRRAGLVIAERSGKFVHYRLTDSSVLEAFAGIRAVAERHSAQAERIIRGYFDQRDTMQPVSRDELTALIRDGLVTVLDVRPKDEYALGHLPGAISAPLAEIERWIDQIEPAKQVVAYCRGPWCVMAFEAVAKLRANGFQARRLQDGLPEWQAAGLVIEAA